jgi:two-component system CheB/CheR fusion protein
MSGGGRDSSQQIDYQELSAERFPTVGIGASAGGVRALQEFFESLPETVEAAFVVVVHLDPEHQSELPAILSARTHMPVTQVTGRIKLQPRHVYVIPPNRQLTIVDQHLSIAEFDEPHWRRAPIDLFFRSLAAQKGDDFAVILSGAGSDGALGIKKLKEAGGFILVQRPDEAEYSSMPRNAIATGLADFILPVRDIATRLPELFATRSQVSSEPLAETDHETIQRILSHLQVRTGHDFSKYKKSTIRRRIARRMQVRRASTLGEYLVALRDNPEEAQALFADLLISVTTFFRDAGAFKKLVEQVVPMLFEDKSAVDVIRVWVPGCATGEEAYSLAMLLIEEAERRDIRPEIQVFASDIDATALASAREGRYPLAVEADLTEDRLRRFFSREADHYRVKRELRDMVLFARHSLLKDPPFSRLDLISCRNLLIYLDRDLQQQVCVTFHFALRPNGYLFLGSSESADASVGLFRIVDHEASIYQRLPTASNGARVVHALAAIGASPEPLPVRPSPAFRAPSEAASHRETLERMAPPSILVDESYRVVHLSETAGRYLQPAGGTLSNDVTELAREELHFDLRAALHRAFSRGEPSLSAPIAVRFNGAQRRVYFQVRTASDDPHAPRLALVFFFEGEASKESEKGVDDIEGRPADEKIRELQQEVQFTQSQLRTLRQEYEGVNEELRAANEELQSINEEYRSTAEELETSKEELQSVNEELQTVNSELKSKLESVSRAHSDIQNLMAATDVGILFLDTQLRIKRFTPRIADLLNIAVGDEGRSITDFTHSLDYDGLADDARTVLRHLASSEREVRSRSGNWYLMRVRPYRTVENKIDGAVVTFVDISERRRSEDALRSSEARMRAVIDGVADAIVTIDESGAVRSLNKATVKMFGYAPDELIGRSVSMLMPEPYRSRHDGYLAKYLETGQAKIIGVSREVEARRKDGTIFPVELMVSEIRHGGERLFIGFMRDLSEKRRFEARLHKLHANRLASMAEMATALAHEINQPLAAATTYLNAARRILNGKLIGKTKQLPELGEALEHAAAQTMQAGRIVGHLREFISRGEPDKTVQSLHALIERACELTSPGAKMAKIDVALRLEAEKDDVLVDKVQIEQAVVNLIRNAIQAMARSSVRKLTIATSLVDGVIRTDVVDTGPGVSIDVADLFEPFTSTKAEGLGVGLSISRSIIEAHYGKIWTETNPGGGAKFSFTLPLADMEGTDE